jgi:hypothetical protein
MSAFIVDYDHINAILSWAIKQECYVPDAAGELEKITAENADTFGQVLADENCRSHNYRYADENTDALDYVFRPFPIELTTGELIRACACLDYQSCETPDWHKTHAYQILLHIRSRATYETKEYETCESAWGINPHNRDRLANAPAPRKRKAG